MGNPSLRLSEVLYIHIHKCFTPIINNEAHVNAQHTEHVCSFILDVVFFIEEFYSSLDSMQII